MTGVAMRASALFALVAAAVLCLSLVPAGSAPPPDGVGGPEALPSTGARDIQRPPNEPAGFQPVTRLAFDGLPVPFGTLRTAPFRPHFPEDWEASDSRHLGVDVEPASPGSPPFVGRATFTAGLGDGVAPVWTRYVLAPAEHRRLFVAFWLKLSENWQGHATGVNKVGYAWIHDDPVVAFAAVGSGLRPLVPQIRLQDVPHERARNLTPNLRPRSVLRGEWHRWEILLVANRPDRRDGEVHWWIDGEKAGEYLDVVLVAPDQDDRWEVVAWRPVWGGRGDRVRETMHMWIDDLYVSRAP